MRKIVIAGVLLILLSACSPNPTEIVFIPSTTPIPDPIREEELVFSTLLQTAYPSELFVIMDMTQTDVIDLADSDTYEYIEKSLPDLSIETLTDFKSRNETSHPIKTSMIMDIEYILFSKNEMQDLFRENQNGWDIFYNRYPEAPGIVSLSRVGFNETMDQALVYLGIQSHWLAGSGTYYLLEKKDGLWFIHQQVMTWIS